MEKTKKNEGSTAIPPVILARVVKDLEAAKQLERVAHASIVTVAQVSGADERSQISFDLDTGTVSWKEPVTTSEPKSGDGVEKAEENGSKR